MSKTKPIYDSQRVTWIDELRGIATLSVFFQHLLWQYSPVSWEKYFDPGIFGVVLFFCISGYVIPYSIKVESFTEAGRFLMLRGFRLYPAYWISLILGALVFQTTTNIIIINATMLQRFLGIVDVVGVYWTLEIEIIFYIIIAILCSFKKISNGWAFIFLSIGFSLVSVFVGGDRFWFGNKAPLAPAAGLAVMFLASTFITMEKSSFIKIKTYFYLFTSVLFILFLSFILGYSRNWGYDENPFRFIFMYSISILLFFSYRKWNPKIYLLNLIGKISYPIYLIHVQTIFIVNSFVKSNLFIKTILIFLLTVLLSVIIHIFIERPFQNFGRTLIKSRQIRGGPHNH